MSLYLRKLWPSYTLQVRAPRAALVFHPLYSFVETGVDTKMQTERGFAEMNLPKGASLLFEGPLLAPVTRCGWGYIVPTAKRRINQT